MFVILSIALFIREILQEKSKNSKIDIIFFIYITYYQSRIEEIHCVHVSLVLSIVESFLSSSVQSLSLAMVERITILSERDTVSVCVLDHVAPPTEGTEEREGGERERGEGRRERERKEGRQGGERERGGERVKEKRGRWTKRKSKRENKGSEKKKERREDKVRQIV